VALRNNISGELTQELLAVGDGVKVTSISLVNVHATLPCTVDLYIERSLAGKFYLAKAIELPVGVTLMFDGADFSNTTNGFGLFIKLTKSASETPIVDVIIS
tara:strand:- start:645 stop:950 length:306 start_codon:yes stop_codon:yes gene_type:complete